MHTSLDTVIIHTSDLEGLSEFYEKALDIGQFNEYPDHRGCQVGPVYLGFDRLKTHEPNSHPRTSLWFSVKDIQATYKKLMGMGARPISPPSRKTWGGFIASVQDPDGNVLGLSQNES